MAGCWVVFENGDQFIIDATTSQGHERSTNVTDHPIEDGSSIADHVTVDPETVSLTGVYAFAPIRTPFDLLTGITLLETDRHKRAFERIDQAIADAEVCTVHTGLKIYESMVITGGSFPREGSSFDLKFTLTFKHVETVEAKSVMVPKIALPAIIKPLAARKGGKGRRSKKKKSAKGLAALTSILG